MIGSESSPKPGAYGKRRVVGIAAVSKLNFEPAKINLKGFDQGMAYIRICQKADSNGKLLDRVFIITRRCLLLADTSSRVKRCLTFDSVKRFTMQMDSKGVWEMVLSLDQPEQDLLLKFAPDKRNFTDSTEEEFKKMAELYVMISSAFLGTPTKVEWPTDPRDLPTKKEQKQKYVQVEHLGEGGQGSVYKVMKIAGGKFFAMKKLTAAAEEQHLKNVKEVKHMLKLSHRNLVPCLDHFMTTGTEQHGALTVKEWRLHIVMPLYTGGDLHAHVMKEGPLPQMKAQRLLQEMADALHYIHNQDFIHRDVKPLNIMLNTPSDAVSGGQAEFVLADLGLSREVVGEGEASTFAGTPPFMSPEFWDQKRYTNKVDMWALAVTVCYVVLSRDMRDRFLKYLKVNRELVMTELRALLPPVFSAPLCELILRLLSINPSERPTAGEVLREVKTATTPTPTATTTTTTNDSASCDREYKW